MGLQLVFCVECDKQSKSDWMYVKATLDHYYVNNNVEVKYSTVFLSGKGNYNAPSKQKEIASFIKQYSIGSTDNKTVVIYALDTDNYDSNPEDATFHERLKSYCSDKGYELVWFCKDVEQVYLDQKVPNTQKKKLAAIFKGKGEIASVDEVKLRGKKLKNKTSNILNVLDKYLEKK